jgi:hypothetical protein
VDYIERLFSISPDGGDGSLELRIALLAVAIPALLLALRAFRSGRTARVG